MFTPHSSTLKSKTALRWRCAAMGNGPHLGALGIGQHASDAADEALAAGRVPAAEAVARLLEIVLLLDDALLALP